MEKVLGDDCACGIGDQSDIGHFHESWCPARDRPQPIDYLVDAFRKAGWQADANEIERLGPRPGTDDHIAISAIVAALRFKREAAAVMYEALVRINLLTSPGNRTLDEMIRDIGYACDEARLAIAKDNGGTPIEAGNTACEKAAAL